MNPLPSEILVRGSVLHFLADPGEYDDSSAWQYFTDGALFIQDGKLVVCGEWSRVLASLPEHSRQAARYYDYRGKLILPGFVDAHAHYPQMRVMGSWGRQLLDWLEDYTFPAEAALADEQLAARTASFFLERLLAHGTTTASVFATVHPHSVDVFFAEAERRKLRMLCGKVMMDRNCPVALRDTAASALRDCSALIARWHGKGRLRYSVTPRFAPSSWTWQASCFIRSQGFTCSRIFPKTRRSWPGWPSFSPAARITWKSMSVTACSAKARFTATAFT